MEREHEEKNGLDARVGGLEVQVGVLVERVGNLDKRVDEGFERVDGDIGKLDAKIDGLNAKFDAKFDRLTNTIVGAAIAIGGLIAGLAGANATGLLGA